MGRGTRTARILGYGLTKLDELEAATRSHRVHVCAKVDDCALSGKDAAAGIGGDDRPSNAVGTIDRDRRI